MSATDISLDELESVVLSSASKRLGISVPAYANVDAIMLRKAAQLIAQGSSVTVVCATKAHANALAAKAKAAPDRQNVPVVFAGDMALAEIEDPRVQEQILRADRVLDANELDVLTEDIKVTGLKIKRLREMLKFFYHSISDCTAEQEGWLVTQEEAMVYAVLEENLEARRALLPCEVYAKAYQGLVAAGVTPTARTIIVDDFGALSASAQRLVEYLSSGNVIAFGNDAFLSAEDEPYPAPEGMRAFLDDERTETFAIAAAAPMKSPVRTLDNPHGEFAHVADAVATQIAGGRAPEDIVVAAPNRTWAKQIGKALAARGIDAFVDLGAGKTKGDPRDAATSANIKLAAFAKLLANPDDFTAYRTFIGVNDWLLGSDGFLELLAFAREHNLTAKEAIPVLCEPENLENATASFHKFLAPVREYEQLRDLWKTEAVGTICDAMQQHGMPLGEHADVLGAADERPNIQAFVDSFKIVEPVQPQGSVAIAPYTRCHGHHCKVLFLTGMIDGFMPKRDAVDDAFDLDHRAKALARDRQMLISIEAIASKEIFYSNFDHDIIENTGALHMVTTRIYHKDGHRMAQISPSSLLD